MESLVPAKLVLLLAVSLGVAVGASRADDAQTPSTPAAPTTPAVAPKTMEACVAEAQKIVAQMTLPEKIAQVHGAGNRQIDGLPRLNIPQYNFTNGPAGVGNGGQGHAGPATALPAPIALAATFDVKQAYAYGRVCGQEALDYSCNMIEAPSVNIVREPEGGRAFEGYGEDPFLAGLIAVADIKGVQDQGINGEVKHFAGNNQETNRLTNDSVIDERTLREIYLPAFEATVKQGHVDAVMSAYNRLNGQFCSENTPLLNDILKTEWKFDGYITSDFGAVHSTVPSALAGLDAEMPKGIFFADPLQAAVDGGDVPVSRIDDMLVRRFSKMMLRGTFHDPWPNRPIATAANGTTARQIADAGMVLLKNDGGLLPLQASQLHSIALLGPGAMKAKTGGGGSSWVHPAYEVAPLSGLQEEVSAAVTITLDDGHDATAAAAIAHDADVAIIMLDDKETEGEDHSIAFSDKINDLVNAVVDANPKTIVVLKTGSAVLMPWVEKVPAILEAWYPGEEDGHAVADLLFGHVNPSGKLPVTFPVQVSDQPAQVSDQASTTYSEGVLVGYRHYDANGIEPLFPFGHGLSYTTFKYENLAVSPGATTADDLASHVIGVDFDVTNTGGVTGAEATQVYVGKPALPDGLVEPPDWLKAAEKGHIHLMLNARAFSYWDVTTHEWKITPGTYKILVGSSSRDIRLQSTVTIN
jgi:beta-glucosidase